MSQVEYQALAEFRFLIERYLKHADDGARSVGLEPQQYQGLLAVRSSYEVGRPTIRVLADRLQITHHSAVGLADRMEQNGLIRRQRSKSDRRKVFLRATPRAERLLSRLAHYRIAELRETAPSLVHALKIAMS